MKRNLLSLSLFGLLITASCSNERKADEMVNGESVAGADTTGPASSMVNTNDSMMADTAMSGSTAPHATDAEFMMSAAHSDQNEIQLSKLVLDKGATGMVKDHANKMLTDHTKSTADLKPIAQKQNVMLPTDMDAEHKAIAADMQKLSGKELETKYMSQMEADHQKTANTMQAHQKMTQDADLQGFIAKTLPVVQGHLAMFRQHAGPM